MNGEDEMKVGEYPVQQLEVRAVANEDAQFLWELANDRDVRANSFNMDPIPWEDHVKWFADRLDDPATLFLVALDAESRPCGQIRFYLQDTEAELNYSLAREARGRGLGARLIEAGLRFLFAHRPVDLVTALVKPDNIASLVTFERTGWVREIDIFVRGARCARFTHSRPREINEG